MDENIRGVCSIEDTAVKLGNFIMNLANFEDQNWKQNLPSILSEEYSIQRLLQKKSSEK